jgi:hypothetical protein
LPAAVAAAAAKIEALPAAEAPINEEVGVGAGAGAAPASG